VIAAEARKHRKGDKEIYSVMTYTVNQADYPLQDETEKIIGLAIEVHKILGPGFLEIVYKDALEHEMNVNDYLFRREYEYPVPYKEIILKHKFYADFVVFDKVIVEIKAKQKGLAEEDLAQAINYLKVSGCKVGLILNFATSKLQIKRVVF
jgi:GxxExxY protein